MHLVVDQMVQLQEVHDTDGNGVLEVVAGTAVADADLTLVEEGLAFFIQSQTQGLAVVEMIFVYVRIVLVFRSGHLLFSQLQMLKNLLVGGAVEDGGGNVPAQRAAGQAQVHFQNLTQVHTGRNAQGVQHDLQGSTVGQEGHILFTQDAGNNTLVTVTACHLIADGNLTLLGDVDADHFVDAGGELVLVLAGEDLDINNDAAFAVGNAQGGIPDFTGFFTEDGAQQALFGGQFGFTLGGNLTDQDIAGVHFGTDADDTAFIQILDRVVRDVRDIPGDLFRSELGFAGFGFELFDMDGGVNVFLDQFFTQQDSVLVVVAFPGHEADQGVTAQTDFSLFSGRTVSQQVAFFDLLARGNHGMLVDAGGLVGTGKLGEGVGVTLAEVITDDNLVGIHLFHHAVFLGQDYNAGVMGGAVFHTGGDEGRFGNQQRHSLTLHVGTHQSTGSVVVLQEGNHGGGNGNNLTGADVHEVHLGNRHFNDFSLVTNRDAVLNEGSVGIQGLVGGGDLVQVFLVSGHVVNFIQHAAVFLVHTTVGSFDEAVLVDAGIGGQRTDQTDVGTFRSLDRADTGVMAVVHVADLERGAVTVQTAGAQGAQTALVGQLSQGVGLVHELGQLGRTEELFDRGADGTDVDQVTGLDVGGILNGHTLTHHALQTAQADADLVLQQFADAAQAAVAQMVDVIRGTDAVGQAQHIVDGGDDVIRNDVLRHEGGDVFLHGVKELIRLNRGDDLLQGGQVNHLEDAGILRIEGQVSSGVNKVVADDLADLAFAVQHDGVHTGVLDFTGHIQGDGVALLDHDLSGLGIDDIFRRHMVMDTGGDGKLLIVLIAANPHQVITLGIKEEGIEEIGGAFEAGGFAGLLALVNLNEAFFSRLGVVTLLDGSHEALVLTHDIDDFGVCAVAQGAQNHGDGQFAGTVNTDPQHIVGVRLIFEPGTAVRDDLGRIELFASFIVSDVKIDAGRADQLADDHALGTVNDESAMVGHEGKVAHKNVGFLDFTGLLILQANKHLQRRRVSDVALTAACNGIFRLVQRIVHEFQHKIPIVVSNGRNIGQNFAQIGIEKALIGVLLYLNQVGHFENFINA